jgi:hypothetical protein
MKRVFVLEGKRLVPLFILLMLLITVSIYDALFTKATPAIVTGDMVHYVSVEQGKLYPQKQLLIFDNLESYIKFLQRENLSLPDQNFDPNNNLAIITMNFQIQNFLSSTDDLGRKVLNVICSEKNAQYKIYIVPKDQKIDNEGIVWNFYDERGRKLEGIKVRINP